MDREAEAFAAAKEAGKTGLHYCPDWDFMAIWDGLPEMEACCCERKIVEDEESLREGD